MAPKKLSDSDKKDILSLYRETEETTSTIAGRYGVSNTTISRILKQSLSDDEYEGLIQQKRAGGIARHQAELEDDLEAEEELLEEAVDTEDKGKEIKQSIIPLIVVPEESPSELPQLHETPTPYRRQRKRSIVTASLDVPHIVQPDLPLEQPPPFDHQLNQISGIPEQQEHEHSDSLQYEAEANTIEEILNEEILAPEEDFEDDLEDEDDLDSDDLEDEDDLDGDDDLEDDAIADDLSPAAIVHVPLGEAIEILPLSEASIPRTFYLVVDRASELITRPLKDFAELGQIPDGEIQEKTLPIFDNHRVAKRFLRRMQRVIKVPDGKMLQKASPYLQAKGITRLLIDGRIYSLSPDS